jgi:hypothetical protein
MQLLKRHYQECEGCVNKEFDPFQCETCIDGSNCESEDTSEELTYDQFMNMVRGEL